MSTELDQAFWERHYGEHGSGAHHGPSAEVVAELELRTRAGRALDAGCGEGADAIWLAERGWRVTAVDHSAVALERAKARAADRAADGAADGAGELGIEWVQAGLGSWTVREGHFDLVSAQYVHVTADVRAAVLRGLAAAVAPGGTLLIVDHDPGARHAHAEVRAAAAHASLTDEAMVALLDPDDWALDVRREPGRDVVLRAARIHD